MKKVILSLVTIGFISTLNAQDMGLVTAIVKVAETKINADKEVAIQKKAKVLVESSTVEGKSKMGNDNVVVGAVGTVVAIGEEVEISGGSKVSGESEMGNDNVVVGTVGTVVLGAH